MQILTLLNEVVQGISVGEGLKYLAAGLSVFTGFAAAIAEGNVAAHALDSMARQPEISGKITTTMIIGQAISETTGIYGFITAILLIFM
jgi:F-type H+-transporting ATPase subunit c